MNVTNGLTNFYNSQKSRPPPVKLKCAAPKGCVFRPLRIVIDDQNAAAEWLHLSNVCGANLFLGQRAMAVRWLCVQVKVEELVEGTLFVSAERLSVDEAVLTIEAERGLKRRA